MSEVPNPYFINIELFWPNGLRANQNEIARVKAVDVNGSTVTDEGQSGFNPATGGWQPVFMQNIAAFYPPRLRPNLRFEVDSVTEQVVHTTQIFNNIPSGSTVRIVIGLSDELVGGGDGGPGTTFRVSGRVRRTDGTAISSGTVRAFDVTAGSEALLGSVSLGTDGAYSITYTSSAFNTNGSPHTLPNLQVRAYDTSGLLLVQSSIISGAGTDQTVDLTTPVTNPDPGTRRVFGSVSNKLELPVSGIKISPRHIAWTSSGIQEIALTPTVTPPVLSDNAGNYSFPYELPLVPSPNDCDTPAGQINLIVYALDASDDSTLYKSSLVFNAAVEQRVDLLVDRVSTFDDSEYLRLYTRLSPCLGVDPLATLTALGQRPDFLDFAAQASGEPQALVLAYVQAWLIAAQIAAKVGVAPDPPLFLLKDLVAPEVIYGLVRTGLGDTLKKLLDVSPDGFFESTVEAVHSGLISPDIEPLLFPTTKDTPTTTDSHDSLLDDWRTVLGTFLSTASADGAPTWQQLLISLVFDGTDPGTIAKRKKIADANFDNQGDFEAMLKELTTTPTPTPTLTGFEAENLRFVFAMYDAADRWFPIVKATYFEKASAGWHSISDLAKVTVDGPSSPSWYTLVYSSLSYSAGLFPGDVPGQGTNSDRARVYAVRLFERFGGVSPQTRFTSTFQATSPTGPMQAVATFLGQYPTFDLENSNVDQFLAALSPPASLNAQEVTALKQVQRVYRVTSDFKAASALITNNLDSALKIAQLDEGTFVAKYQEALGGLTAATNAHRVAVHYSSEVMFTLVKFHQNLTNVGGVTAIPGPVDFHTLNPTNEYVPHLIGDTFPGTTRLFPNWVTLFGDLNKCACKECQTILSAGAYMVDLLEFINGGPKKTLFARRPDLMDIEITCPNTNAVLPYIDLVNEVLEAVVVPLTFTLPAAITETTLGEATQGVGLALTQIRQAFLAAGYSLSDRFVVKLSALDKGAAHPPRYWVLEDDAWRFTISGSSTPYSVSAAPQTNPKNDSLEVFPEHFNTKAYEKLQTAVFPFNLPLALGREEIEIFLKAKNAPLYQVREAFSTEDLLTQLQEEADALAFLNLTQQESNAILARPVTDPVATFWGLDPTAAQITLPRPDQPTISVRFNTGVEVSADGTISPVIAAWIKVLTLVPFFLHRTGLSYQQLLDLLDTQFVNQETASAQHRLHIVADSTNDDISECNYNNFQIAHLNEPTLRRVSVFVRLWRKLGWTMREVDRYLMDIEGGLVPNDLVTLAQVKRLIDQSKQKPLAIIAWWRPMDTRRTARILKSLFDQVFLVGLASQPEIQSLERIAQGETIGIADGELAEGEDLKSHVRAALRVSAKDIELLWDSFIGSGTTLSLEQLSGMYRVATFSAVMHLSVKDYYDVLALVGSDPFTDGITDASQIPAAVLATYAAIREVSRWQLTRTPTLELSYLLTNQSQDGDPFVPTEKDYQTAAQRLATAVGELSNAYPELATPDAAALTTQLSKVLPADKVVRAIQILEGPLRPPVPGVNDATVDDLNDYNEQVEANRAFLGRYFDPFLPTVPADRVAFISKLVTFDANFTVAQRDAFVWGKSASHPELAPALYTYLVERARDTAAFAAASELIGTDVDTTDRLLTEALSSLHGRANAAEDWKAFLHGGWDSGESVIQNGGPGVRKGQLLVPRAGQYRFVAVIDSTTATSDTWSLTVGGNAVVVDSVVPALTPGVEHVEVLFSPIALNGSTVVDIQFNYEKAAGNTGTPRVTLKWRIDNADPVLVPQSALLPFDREVYLKLYKAARLSKDLKLSKSELEYLVSAANVPFDFDHLPVRPTDDAMAWSELASVIDLLALNRSVSLQSGTLFEFFLDAAGDATLEDVAALTGWKADDIATIRDLFPATTFADPALWTALQAAFKIIGRLDLRASQIQNLLLDQPPSIAIAGTLRNVFRAQFSEDTWKDVFKPFRDKLRQRQRDALVGYLTSHPVTIAGVVHQFVDANDLYAQLLIDTQMEPDTLISRIVLANSVIQLFVDRVFLGLEDQASLIQLEQAKEQWVWMSRYRVWQAARQVFLYPENWIEPELRDDKSEFFKQLEEELQQGGATDAIGVTALTNYLDKMGDVSNLEVVGSFAEPVGTAKANFILHVVGRTRSQSHAFYYRQFIGRTLVDGTWTPWQQITLDIQADVVAPIMYQGRLHLFWPNIQTKQKPPPHFPKTVTGDNIAAPDPSQQATFVNEIRLTWSEFNPGTKKWSKPKLSKNKAVDTAPTTPFDRAIGEDQPSTEPYHLRLEQPSPEFVKVRVIKTAVPSSAGALSPEELGAFQVFFTGEDTISVTKPALTFSGNTPPSGMILKHNRAESAQFNVDGFPWHGDLTFRNNPPFLETNKSFRMFATNFGYLNPAAHEPYFVETETFSFFALDKGPVRLNGGLGNTVVDVAKFTTFQHPLLGVLQNTLHESGPGGIMNRLTQALPIADNAYYSNYSYYGNYYYYGSLYLGYHIAGDDQAWGTTQRMFESHFSPGEDTVYAPYPLPTVEFGYGTPFGIYNWELFFHAPMLIAGQLSQNLQFEDAMKWYHYVFDPRRDLEVYELSRRFVSGLPIGCKYWNFLPFFANRSATDSLSETLGLKKNLSVYDKAHLGTLIDAWKHDPFNPHLIARQRIAAYQKNVVMKYLDNLIAWADSLFRLDSFEAINQATQLYVLADEILGRKPQVIEPLTGEIKYTFRELQARGIDDFSNAIVEAENLLVTNRSFVKENTPATPAAPLAALQKLTVKSFYFAIPRNERLDKFWDTVADRLFKIRNSMNIDGVKRQLALFEPPIDPALLVRASAAGLDLSSVLGQLNAPMPLYRFNVWIQKSIDLCNEVKSFGAEFLAALEKKDAESLQILRQNQEIKMLALVERVKEQQIVEAEENIEALNRSRELAVARRDEYQRRIAENRTEAEKTQLSATSAAITLEELEGGARALGAIFAFVPDAKGGAVGIFPTALVDLKVGAGMVWAANVAGDILGILASSQRGKASMAGLNSGFDRRLEDWRLQKSQADLEIHQLDQQIVVANIRLDIAQKELQNHEVQSEQAQQTLDFLSDKFTNVDLYQFMVTTLNRTYQAVYKLAFNAARTAERAFQFELGVDDSFIQFGYVDSLHKGLLAGEQLIYDLKRMDVAFLERNKRELEIQKPISLAVINGRALQDLRETGACEFDLPEVLFDLDFPGQYFRRIRAVRLTIPCVTGPHTSVSAKLSLLSSAMRKDSAADSSEYAYGGFEDQRFVHDLVGIQSIATSSAQNDAGLFELNFRDERYLPFEGAGVISRWRLELPTKLHQFDYNTISDVVMQLSYTARDAGGTLRKGAEEQIQAALNTILKTVSESETGLVRAFSLRKEFPDVFHRLLTSPAGTEVGLEILPEHLPFILRSSRPELTLLDDGQVTVRAIAKAEIDPSGVFDDAQVAFNNLTLLDLDSSADPRVAIKALPTGYTQLVEDWAPQPWTLKQSGLSADTLEDLVFIVKYTVAA
ncbi:MAG TPA: neuraminidase-like domain-containing protein [Polyangiaceae bacterium]|nr:neuraminidase-like domain-containing protein [Polyangiaceae bacterium]